MQDHAMDRPLERTSTTRLRVEAFCATADTLSYAKAARRMKALGMGTGRTDRVWRLVEELETDLFASTGPSTKLFRRATSAERASPSDQLALTDLGQRVRPQLTELRHAYQRLFEIARPATDPLRVGCYPAHVRSFVAELLAHSKAALTISEVDDQFRADQGHTLLDSLVASTNDLVIAPRSDRPEFDHLDLYRWRLVAVGAKRRLEQPSQPATPDGLSDHDLLLSPDGHGSSQYVREAFLQAGCDLRIRHQSPNTESLLAMADAGLGVAILPSDAVWPSGGRWIVPFESLKWSGTYALHWMRGQENIDRRLFEVLKPSRRIARRLMKSE
jgi:DNA-binding transcriptional LysR family regulator